MNILHRRADGSYVVELNGHPYHVTQDDSLFPHVEELAAELTLEPDPPVMAQVIAPAPRLLTPREFMDRLAMPRQAEITAAAMQSPAALLWLIRLAGAQEVDPAHPETAAGVEALRVAGVITTQEAAALLAPV